MHSTGLLRLDDSPSSVHTNQQDNGIMGLLEVDLFAFRLTHQLPCFSSWRPDPAAEATDAYTQNWTHFQGFANPPWGLTLPTLAKIQREKVKIVLVAPFWGS